MFDRLERIRHRHGEDSAAENTPDWENRRSEPRITQGRRTLTMIAGSDRAAFRLGNLSSRGASGETLQILAPGKRVSVQFEDGRAVDAIVRWARKGLAGIQFVVPLPLDLVHGKGKQQSGRAPRYKVARPARISVGRTERPATILNISSGGLLIETSFSLLPGQSVLIQCGRLTRLAAQVRWSRGSQAGLMFAEPISLEQFEEATAPQ